MPRRACGAFAVLVLISLSGAALAGDAARHGLHIEKWPNGKRKLVCWYKEGVLHGSHKEFNEQGRLETECTYRDGKIEGVYKKYYPSGRPRLAAQYRAGKKHGRLVELDERGRIVRDQEFIDGLLKYPRSQLEISQALKKIYSAAPGGGGGGGGGRGGTLYEKPASHEGKMKAGRLAKAKLNEALAHLKAYRYLAGVPYEDVALNGRYNDEAQHATVLLAVLGRLNHTPSKPAGMEEEFFKKAYAGTSHSNLSMGRSQLTRALDSWMNDSDPSNIDRVGHRRWCINPTMKETGFGLYGKFAAVWALDRARRPAPKFETVPWPCAGYMPAKYFGPRHAWSVSLKPAKYLRPSKAEVKAKIFELDENFRDTSGPLELDYFNVNTQPFGVRYCVIFRPKSVKLSSGSRYRVEIEGIKEKAGRKPAKVGWVTEFFRLQK